MRRILLLLPTAIATLGCVTATDDDVDTPAAELVTSERTERSADGDLDELLQCGRDARAAYHAGAETDPARYEHLVDASVCFERAGKWDSAWVSHAMLLQRHPQSDAAEASRGALVRLTDAILDADRYRETLYGRRCLAPLVGGADAEATAEGSELVSVAICLQEAGALAGALAYRDKAGDRTETGTIDAQANAAVLAKLELTMRRLVQARDNDGIVEFAASPPT